MLDNVVTVEAEKVNEIEILSRKQDDLERELRQLKNLYREAKEANDITFGRVYQRIEDVEKEIGELREALNELKTSVGTVQKTVNDVHTSVTEINVKQDIAITAQDKFIGQLWKMVFVLLGALAAGASAIFTLNQ